MGGCGRVLVGTEEVGVDAMITGDMTGEGGGRVFCTTGDKGVAAGVYEALIPTVTIPPRTFIVQV